MSDSPPSLPVPGQIIPHATPFLFVDEAVEVNEEWGRFLWRFPGGRHGKFALSMFPELALIEALTQATATWSAITIPRDGPEEGFLVAAERFVFQSRPREGDEIELRVFRRKIFGGLALFRVEAHLGRELMCSGEVTVFRGSAQGELPRLPQDSRSYNHGDDFDSGEEE
ncbi:hypothetical protein L6R50_16520 [Myxococcota bacterium]|nr:hypothetical protein [Myxococcota bacterium]